MEAPKSRIDRLATAQHGVLSKRQLREAGLTKRKVDYAVEVGRFRRLPAGCVALAGSPVTWEQQAAWAGLAAGPIGGVSHRSSARLLSLRTVDSELDVVIRHPRRLTLPGVKVVRSRDLMKRDLTTINGIPSTTPERTLCDLGLIFPQHEVMRMLRHAVASGLVVAADVARMRNRIGKQGRNGAGVIGRCLDDLPALAGSTESGPEVMFLELCERFGLPTPELQFPVIVAGHLYRLDFAYPANHVFVEIDGASIHGDPRQIAADDGRQNDLVAAEWRPIRFTYLQLKETPERCAAQLRDLLRICAPIAPTIGAIGAQIA